MKFRLNTINAIAPFGCLFLSFLIGGCGKPQAEEFEAAKWDNLVETQLDKNLSNYFSTGTLPDGQEKAFLIWAFQKDPEAVEGYIREYADQIPTLPWYLSDGAWDLVKEREIETGMRMLSLANELFPNNPDVLGITGIIAYLRGDTVAARRLLEEAESWRRNRPIVDFYLGGLLVQSESAADRTRGKAILMELVAGNDEELRELAGMTLLTNLSIPMIRQDVETIFNTLQENGTFQLDNPNLPAEAIRITINRLARSFPEKAMTLADLLMQYPEINVEDTIGIIRLSQDLQDREKARKYLDRVQANPEFMSQLEGDPRLERLLAVQAFMEESYDSGMAAMEAFVTDPNADAAALQQTFQSVIDNDLPMSVQGELLKLYLTLPVQNVRTTLLVLSKLIQIEPLQGEEWIAYAIENLLEEDPVQVGGWLAMVEASQAVIDALGGDVAALSPDEALVLINAYIAKEEADTAEATLNAAKGMLDPVMESYFRAQILAQQGKLEEAAIYWEEARQGVVGSNRFPLMKNLGLLALKLNQPVNALQALYTALSAGIPFTQGEAGQLIQLTLEYGNLRQSIQVSEYLVENYPQSDLHKNNLAYFKFLAEEQVAESVEVMRELVDKYPEINQFRLTLALGLVKAGRTNEASRLLQSTDIDWDETSTRGLLIYAVVLAASDQQTVAEGLLQNLDLDILIPEEKALLEAF